MDGIADETTRFTPLEILDICLQRRPVTQIDGSERERLEHLFPILRSRLLSYAIMSVAEVLLLLSLVSPCLTKAVDDPPWAEFARSSAWNHMGAIVDEDCATSSAARVSSGRTRQT